MSRRTSLYLSDELDAAVKASGLPLAELVRRGLAPRAQDGRQPRSSGPAVPGGYPAPDDLAAWLSGVLGRLDDIEGRLFAVPDQDTRERQRAEQRHAELLIALAVPGHDRVTDIATAAAALGVSATGARSRLHLLADRGLAELLPPPDGRPANYQRYRLKAPGQPASYGPGDSDISHDDISN